jgi:hypothetical protein
VNRSIAATALASLIVLTAQAAFADTTAAVAAAPVSASVSMPAVAQRPAARIPGTFAAASYRDAIDQVYVLMPALSGNG